MPRGISFSRFLLLPKMVATRQTQHRAFTSTAAAAMEKRALIPTMRLVTRRATTVSCSHTPLLTSNRCQGGGLAALMRDREDVYIDAVQALDLNRIAQLACDGPPSIGYLAPRRSVEVKEKASESPLHRRAAASSAEAVLQSLHEAGLTRMEAAESRQEEESARSQSAYDALPAEEKQKIFQQRLSQHAWEGMCAVNAVLRIQVETSSPDAKCYTADDLSAAYSVFEYVMRIRKDIEAAVWAEEFLPELSEFKQIFEFTGDGRPVVLTEEAK